MIPGESGRLKRLTIGPETLIYLLTRGIALRMDGVPEGARVVDCGYSPEHRAFYTTLEHESFDPVPQGEYIPALLAGITVTHPYQQEVSLGS